MVDMFYHSKSCIVNVYMIAFKNLNAFKSYFLFILVNLVIFARF